MDEPLQELEAELKSMRLRTLSPRLLERIESELTQPEAKLAPAPRRYTSSTNLTSWKWLGWRTAGLTAAGVTLGVFGWITLSRPALPPVALAGDVPAAIPVVPKASPADAGNHDRYRPVAASNVLYDLKDEGPAESVGTTPARRVRYRYLDTYTWKSPRTNASLTWSVPRDEIRVIPASLH